MSEPDLRYARAFGVLQAETDLAVKLARECPVSYADALRIAQAVGGNEAAARMLVIASVHHGMGVDAAIAGYSDSRKPREPTDPSIFDELEAGLRKLEANGRGA